MRPADGRVLVAGRDAEALAAAERRARRLRPELRTDLHGRPRAVALFFEDRAKSPSGATVSRHDAPGSITVRRKEP
jgi:hypothetical protein